MAPGSTNDALCMLMHARWRSKGRAHHRASQKTTTRAFHTHTCAKMSCSRLMTGINESPSTSLSPMPSAILRARRRAVEEDAARRGYTAPASCVCVFVLCLGGLLNRSVQRVDHNAAPLWA